MVDTRRYVFCSPRGQRSALSLLHLLRCYRRWTGGVSHRLQPVLAVPWEAQREHNLFFSWVVAAGRSAAEGWGWAQSCLCRKGCSHCLLELCPVSWHYTSVFLSASHLTLTCHPVGEKKLRGISCSLITKEFLNRAL